MPQYHAQAWCPLSHPRPSQCRHPSKSWRSFEGYLSMTHHRYRWSGLRVLEIFPSLCKPAQCKRKNVLVGHWSTRCPGLPWRRPTLVGEGLLHVSKEYSFNLEITYLTLPLQFLRAILPLPLHLRYHHRADISRLGTILSFIVRFNDVPGIAGEDTLWVVSGIIHILDRWLAVRFRTGSSLVFFFCERVSLLKFAFFFVASITSALLSSSDSMIFLGFRGKTRCWVLSTSSTSSWRFDFGPDF